MRSARLKTGLVVSVLLLGAVELASGRTITVDCNGSADFNNIQAAINDANDHDVIVVRPCVYTGPGNRDVDFLGKAITLRSTDPNDPNVVAATVIDSNGGEGDPHRGFYFHSAEGPNSVLAGLTITNGYASAGGGICCDGSDPTIRDCLITSNRACILEIIPWGAGGGVDCSYSSPSIIRCTIEDNLSWHWGGGISCDDSTPKISNCIISGNSAVAGGGVSCLFSNSILEHCTITDNSGDVGAGGGGGGIYCELCTPQVRGCILWGNDPGQISGQATVSYSDLEGGYAGVGNINADPLFVEPAAGDYHLQARSPCVESGDPCYIPAAGEKDIDGQPRRIGDRVDMGADEYLVETPLIGLAPTAFEFFADVGGPNPESQTLFIRNMGIDTLNWEVTQACPWLEVDPCNGESAGEVNEVVVAVDISGLAWGHYVCELTVTGQGAADSPRTVLINLYVNDELDVPSEYWTIQEAIDAAIKGDTVVLAAGTYTGAGNRDLNFRGKAITVRSSDPNDPAAVAATIIDCNGTSTNRHRGFKFVNSEAPDSVLAGVTIANGCGPREDMGPGTTRSCGGAVYCRGSSPTIKLCRIVGNWASYNGRGKGGGIACGSNSSPTISKCMIQDNFASEDGGGIVCYRASRPTFDDCTIKNNSAGELGGGIYDLSSDSALTGCTIWGNSANVDGGGMYFESGGPVLIHCRIEANWAINYGGGVRWKYSSLRISHCTLAHNSANCGGGAYCETTGYSRITDCTVADNGASDGGGIYARGADVIIGGCVISGNRAFEKGGAAFYHNCTSQAAMRNCTVTNNSAVYGGGICSYYAGDPTISNCILWGDTADFGPEIAILEDNAQLSVSYSGVMGGQAAAYVEPTGTLNWGPGNINTDPRFAYPTGEDYHLKSEGGRWDPNSETWVTDNVTSACIDKGDPVSDVGDEPLPNGGVINMGAYGGTEQASKSLTCWHLSACPCQQLGDATCDGHLNLADLFALKAHFGTCAPWTPPQCCADFTHDGCVNLSDLYVMKGGFGCAGCCYGGTGNQNCPP